MQKTTKIKGFARLKLIFILALMSSIAPLSTDMYLPALENVQRSFDTSAFLTQLSLASFFIAFALGQLIYGPLSDTFGRKKPLIVGMAIFILSSLGCFLIDDIYVFIFLRFLEALGGCAGVVIARAVVNDIFELKDAASVFALMMVVSSLAPMLAPSFGSLLLQLFSWHSIFMSLFALGIILFLLIVFSLKESAPAKKNAHFSNKDTIHSYKIVLENKVFLAYVFAGALTIAGMFAYITSSSFIFQQIFKLSQSNYAILFGINALGFVIFANINAKIVQKISPFVILPRAFVFMCIASMLLFMTSFMQSFLLFELCVFFFIAMLGFIMPNLTTLAMACFKERSGTASAVLGTIQFGFAGFISFVVGISNANTPFALALIVLICVCLGASIYFLGTKKAKFSTHKAS